MLSVNFSSFVSFNKCATVHENSGQFKKTALSNKFRPWERGQLARRSRAMMREKQLALTIATFLLGMAGYGGLAARAPGERIFIRLRRYYSSPRERLHKC